MDKIDILSREEFVDNLVNLVEHIAKNKRSTSFAINGTWGSGKSFVLDMLEDRLSRYESDDNSCDKYFVIHYNCWKYDYYEEPLVAIVAAMIDIINEQTRIISNGETRAKIVGVLKSVGATLLSMANSTIKDKTGVDIRAAYDLVKEGADSGAADFEKSKEYDVYFSFKQALNSLQGLIGQISEEQAVVFVVDELDRCLPEYSIKILERLHHLFEDIPNVQLIISMDKEQYGHAIQQIFGQDTPVDKYLSKFIDFELQLDEGDINEEYKRKFQYYMDNFDYLCKKTIEGDVDYFTENVFRGMDIRTCIKIIDKCNLRHQLLNKTGTKSDYSVMCLEIVFAVMKHWGVDLSAIQPSFNIRDVFKSKRTSLGLSMVNQKIVSQGDKSIYYSVGKDDYGRITTSVKMLDIWGAILACYRYVLQYHDFIDYRDPYNSFSLFEYSEKYVRLLNVIQ